MASSSSKDNANDIGWMYEGTKSLLSREDYLLGKKIDRNCEFSSDINREEDVKNDFYRRSLLGSSVPVREQKISALELRTVRNEDPLVALKFQEEQRKRELLENPLFKLKAQRVLKKAFQRQLKKEKGRLDINARCKESTTSSDDEAKKGKRKRRKNKSRDKRKRNSRDKRECTDSNRIHHDYNYDRNSSLKEKDEMGYRGIKEKSGRDRREQYVEERSGTSRLYSHNRTEDPKVHRHQLCEKNAKRSSSVRKLSAVEIERRHKAMTANAEWRNEMRNQNIKKLAEESSKEEWEASHKSKFTKSLLNSANMNSNLEKRLQSNRMKIQRTHDHMEKSFTKM